ncbi:apomucin isoform X2 [Zea mays]|uniref:Uncharacterized protein n=1 Tax=Zea mays TaxID=4577 RepID=A0A804PS15_MAIZE|nr:apomucin isoform X2 [Zea mays]|eukprot:XP_008648518.1 apomucin-like isoform X2 [Zea mays]
MLKRQGLTGARLVRNFMHRRIQPLKARQRPMHRYSGVNDPDRHSFEPLALSEIEARVKVVTALSSGSFMDEDSPHPLSGKVSSDLGNGPLAPSLPPLPEVLAVQAERKHKRSDGETLGARMKRLRAQKKGKRVMRPSKSSEGATFSSDSNDASSTASSWEDLAALTGGPMCRGDAVASSNVPVEAGGPAADPPLVAASSADGAGVAAASEVAQLFTGAGGITEGGATHPAALEAASWATPRSFVPSLVAQGKVVTRKRSSRAYVSHKSVKDAFLVARGAPLPPQAFEPTLLGGMPPPAVGVVPLGVVSSASPAVATPSTQVILKAAGAATPDVVLIDSSPFASASGEAPAVGAAALSDSLSGQPEASSLPLPAPAPPPSVTVGAGGSPRVSLPAPGSAGLREQAVLAVVAGGSALPVRPVGGDEAEVEE